VRLTARVRLAAAAASIASYVVEDSCLSLALRVPSFPLTCFTASPPYISPLVSFTIWPWPQEATLPTTPRSSVPDPSLTRQEAQLSQRDCATLRVIEYFAKSFKVTQGHSKWYPWVGCVSAYYYSIETMYLVQFLRHSASNNGVTLKSWIGVVQGRWTWHCSIDHIRFTIGLPL